AAAGVSPRWPPSPPGLRRARSARFAGVASSTQLVAVATAKPPHLAARLREDVNSPCRSFISQTNHRTGGQDRAVRDQAKGQLYPSPRVRDVGLVVSVYRRLTARRRSARVETPPISDPMA